MDENELRNSLTSLHTANFAWAMHCCRDRESAEEVLQSVYVKVLDGRAPWEGRSSFRTWLFAVIRNAARDQLRKRWWSHVVRLELEWLADLSDPTSVEDAKAAQDDEIAFIRAAVSRLPARQRQVAHLVFYEGLTIADAAHVMGVRVGTARRHYARAKGTLKRFLKPLQNQNNESII